MSAAVEGQQELRAMCECGRWTTKILHVLTAALFGQFIVWRCIACGRKWMTR